MNSEEVFGNPAQFGLAAPSGVEPCSYSVVFRPSSVPGQSYNNLTYLPVRNTTTDTGVPRANRRDLREDSGAASVPHQQMKEELGLDPSRDDPGKAFTVMRL